MKRIIITLGAAMCFLLPDVAANAADTHPAMDSIAVAIRVKQLEKNRNDLRRTIASEDQKRNRQDLSLAPETIEMINVRQDSVCLALRSRLLSVELELRELTPDKMTQTLTTLYNSLKTDAQKKEDE